MQNYFKYLFILFFTLGANINSNAQVEKSSFIANKISIGLNYGQAKQEYFPYYNSGYLYENKFIKGQINYLIKQKDKIKFEALIEPGFYQVNYQWLNWYFIQGETGMEYLRQNYSKNELELLYAKAIKTSLMKDYEYSQLRTFNEYALNFGLIIRFSLTKNISSYVMASVGPMHNGKHTERLIKGFAFSDIMGCGVSYRYNRLIFDTRFTLRHTSNANIKQPNYGHNSAGLEAGISFVL